MLPCLKNINGRIHYVRLIAVAGHRRKAEAQHKARMKKLRETKSSESAIVPVEAVLTLRVVPGCQVNQPVAISAIEMDPTGSNGASERDR